MKFLVAAAGALVISWVGWQAVQTLRVLDAVEQDRDRWQKPREIVEPLNLKDGGVVADIGSGAGYFTLKLASIAGAKGGVLAIDLRRESLAFLWIRTLLRGQHNVHVVHADAADPHLFKGPIDAVLIANTYHEFAHPRAVLTGAFAALRPDGRIVIADRGPLPEHDEGAHEVQASAVEDELRKSGFEPIDRRDNFIDSPAAGHPWWLIVARKPPPREQPVRPVSLQRSPGG